MGRISACGVSCSSLTRHVAESSRNAMRRHRSTVGCYGKQTWNIGQPRQAMYRSDGSWSVTQSASPIGNTFLVCNPILTTHPNLQPVPQHAELTLVACQPGTIVAVRQRLGGIAAVPGGGEEAVVW